MERLGWKQDTTRDITILLLTTLAITLLIWAPHILRLPNFLGLNFSQGFATIYRNYDGLEYVLIAKSLYRPEIISQLPQSLPDIYYASHFPGYALSIFIGAFFFGYLKSMLITSLLFTFLSAVMFYVLVRDFLLTERPLILSIIFLVLPARWLIVHSVGSSEPMFIFSILGCLYYFIKFEQTKKINFILLSGLFGGLAQFTRPPGILIFFALLIYLITKYLKTGRQKTPSYLPIFIIPLTLLGVFYWYHLTYGDFFAYFHTGDNIHLTLPPFSVFNQYQYWVGDIWLEDVIYIFLIGFSSAFLLLKRKLNLFAITIFVYLGVSALVAHRDISRYALPVFPLVLIGLEKYLVSKEFRVVLLILSLGFYLYAQNFILANTAPIPNMSLLD